MTALRALARQPAWTLKLSASSVAGEPSAATVVLLASTVAPADLAPAWPERLPPDELTLDGTLVFEEIGAPAQ